MLGGRGGAGAGAQRAANIQDEGSTPVKAVGWRLEGERTETKVACR